MLTLSLISLLLWVGSSHAQFDANCDGKQVIVQLFEWKWVDIGAECEHFLSKAGYCGVQVSPPTEHIILDEQSQPWWQRYQPVSYKLHSRSGTEEEFAQMVKRCNSAGVRIYVDAVINHMVSLGRQGVSYEGSTYDADALDFPGVPYTSADFTPRELCPSADGIVNDYNNTGEVRNCYLYALTDLNQATENVRGKIAGYLSHLVELGVAGIHIDAAKYMWPEDLEEILIRIPDLPEKHGFQAGTRLFVYQEVIDYNDGAIHVDEYFHTGLVTEFRYPQRLATAIREYSELENLIDFSTGMAQADRALIFVDNQNTQRSAGNVITFKSSRDYKQATAYTLAQPYGLTRVMSSYAFDTTDQGPPHNDDFSIMDVETNSDGSCLNGWVCEHRWRSNANMVEFRNTVVGTEMENYWNNGGAVAFSRGNIGFFAMAREGRLNETLVTGLPAGTYCNIVNDCETKVTVEVDGTARILIENFEEPILAICVGCRK